MNYNILKSKCTKLYEKYPSGSPQIILYIFILSRRHIREDLADLDPTPPVLEVRATGETGLDV